MPFYSRSVATDPNGPTDCIWLRSTLACFNAPSAHLVPVFSYAVPVLTLLLSGPAPSSWVPASEGPGARPLPRPELCGAPLCARPGAFGGNRTSLRVACCPRPCGLGLYSCRCEAVLTLSRYRGWPLGVSGSRCLSPVGPRSPRSEENG